MNKRAFLLKITEKWPVKVISLAAALIISVFYRLNTLETRTFTIPLKVQGSESIILISSIEDSVKVTLRGEPNSIFPILEEDIEAYIDIGRYSKGGSYRTPVKIRKKGSALGVEPLEITVAPIEIHLQLEEKISLDTPVYPVFRGRIAQGYDLLNQAINPEIVVAEGPRSILENQKAFFTEPIDLEGRNTSFTTLVNIVNNNPLITIHGNRMIEYTGTINRIERAAATIEIHLYEEEDDEDDVDQDQDNENNFDNEQEDEDA